MDYENLSKLCSLLAKPFARDLLRLLVLYESLSASEAASRLNLHIKTAQDFLEGLAGHGIVRKEEASERKRPYFRYTLTAEDIRLEFDLKSLGDDPANRSLDNTRIRERKNADCAFKTSPAGNAVSAVTLFTGNGRDRRERRISLTVAQGKFLFHLPFPTEKPNSVRELIAKAGLNESSAPEILDIVRFLEEQDIIELS